MSGQIVGYARVSSIGQSLEVQLETLDKAGVEKIFKEKKSGASSKDRVELQSMLKYVRSGDIVVVTKLDRIARSMVDFWNIVEMIEGIGASIRILDMSLDTNTSQGRLTMGILSSVAEFERSLIRERQAEGLAKAKAKGVILGRPKVSKERIEELVKLESEGLTKKEIAKQTGIGESSVYRLLKEYKESVV